LFSEHGTAGLVPAEAAADHPMDKGHAKAEDDNQKITLHSDASPGEAMHEAAHVFHQDGSTISGEYRNIVAEARREVADRLGPDDTLDNNIVCADPLIEDTIISETSAINLVPFGAELTNEEIHSTPHHALVTAAQRGIQSASEYDTQRDVHTRQRFISTGPGILIERSEIDQYAALRNLKEFQPTDIELEDFHVRNVDGREDDPFATPGNQSAATLASVTTPHSCNPFSDRNEAQPNLSDNLPGQSNCGVSNTTVVHPLVASGIGTTNGTSSAGPLPTPVPGPRQVRKYMCGCIKISASQRQAWKRSKICLLVGSAILVAALTFTMIGL
jgi:hypothetical protein